MWKERDRVQHLSSRSKWKFITEDELFTDTRTKHVPDERIPEKIRTLIGMTEPFEHDPAKRDAAFLRQARFMEDYEEPYEMIGRVARHMTICYQVLSVDEMRGYFSWRAQVRRGGTPEMHRAFVSIYLAELINLIGAKSPEDALQKILLLQACNENRWYDPEHLYRRALRMLIVVHGMDRQLADAWCIDDPCAEGAKLALAECAKADDRSVFQALSELVPNAITRSRFLVSVPEDTMHILARVWRRLSVLRQKETGETFAEHIFHPVLRPEPTALIPASEWFPFDTSEDGYRYEVTPITSFVFQKGKWYFLEYPDQISDEARRELSDIIRECDRLMRNAFHYKNTLPPKLSRPELTKLIETVIREWLEEKKVRNRPEIRIDLSKLSAIRTAAAQTREKLLEGTDEAEEYLSFALPKAIEDAVDAEVKTEGDSRQSDIAETAHGMKCLKEIEYVKSAAGQRETEEKETEQSETERESRIFEPEQESFLRLLLAGENWQTFIRERNLILSVFADHINETAFDLIGDSILETDGENCVIIEDYADEVREMISTE